MSRKLAYSYATQKASKSCFSVKYAHLGVLAAVEGVQSLGWDTAQELPGEEAEQRPGEVQRLVDVAGVVRTLGHELVLELVQELQVQLGRQGRCSSEQSDPVSENLKTDFVGAQLATSVTKSRKISRQLRVGNPDQTLISGLPIKFAESRSCPV